MGGQKIIVTKRSGIKSDTPFQALKGLKSNLRFKQDNGILD
jgi:hypothetical protein